MTIQATNAVINGGYGFAKATGNLLAVSDAIQLHYWLLASSFCGVHIKPPITGLDLNMWKYEVQSAKRTVPRHRNKLCFKWPYRNGKNYLAAALTMNEPQVEFMQVIRPRNRPTHSNSLKTKQTVIIVGLCTCCKFLC